MITASSVSPTALARTFRVVAVAEACSWVGLLIGMAFKYLVVFDDIGVRVFGPIHGALFVAYVVVTAVTAHRFAWDRRTAVLGLLASIPPLTTVLFERVVSRRGLLDPSRLRPASPAARTGAGRPGA